MGYEGSAVRREKWRVSAPHASPRRKHTDEPRRPFATAHARRVGASTTACGLAAAGWPFFWELTVETKDLDLCPACASIAGIQPALV